MAVSTITAAASSESYAEFLDTDLDKIREMKNSSRRPLALLFELEGELDKETPAGGRGSQEGSYKRQKIEQTSRDSTPTTVQSESSWSMYEEGDGEDIEVKLVERSLVPKSSKMLDEEEEKENVAIASQHNDWHNSPSDPIHDSVAQRFVKANKLVNRPVAAASSL